jgi:hypothetical protein
MKRIRYTKYKGGLAGEIDLSDLMAEMSDFFLDSGFNDPLARFQEMNGEQTMDNLREVIRQALEDGDLLTDEQREKLENMSPEEQEEFLDQMVERLQQENYINADPDNAEMSDEPGNGGPQDDGPTEARFEVTDKSMDFLGYRSLRDLLGSLGKSSFGRHETVHLASGIEAVGASRPYEFGDVLNLDVTTTLKSAQPGVQRPAHLSVRVSIELRDRGDAGLLPLHDPVRRGPFYSGQARGHGALAPHPHAVSRRHAFARALP